MNFSYFNLVHLPLSTTPPCSLPFHCQHLYQELTAWNQENYFRTRLHWKDQTGKANLVRCALWYRMKTSLFWTYLRTNSTSVSFASTSSLVKRWKGLQSEVFQRRRVFSLFLPLIGVFFWVAYHSSWPVARGTLTLEWFCCPDPSCWWILKKYIFMFFLLLQFLPGGRQVELEDGCVVHYSLVSFVPGCQKTRVVPEALKVWF